MQRFACGLKASGLWVFLMLGGGILSIRKVEIWRRAPKLNQKLQAQELQGIDLSKAQSCLCSKSHSTLYTSSRQESVAHCGLTRAPVGGDLSATA